ncbi:MAG: VIT1/CCC1 transporter family protein, partial [Thermomicrobiaceae bacterium]|nr:VIT1/CCC1 transporter family protein [Thermomicrobiaceae bacterium]
MTTTGTERLIQALTDNWKAEQQSAATYRLLAGRETDPRRRELLQRLAEAEERHAARWAARLRELGAEPPSGAVPVPMSVRVRARADIDAVLQRIEAEEEEHIRRYEQEAEALADPETAALFREVARDEARHARTLRAMTSPAGAEQLRARLQAILKGERHVTSGSWIADAIYGANDGLGAVFGLVAGVAGADVSSRFILLAGLAGAVASAVSMGSGAFL